MDLSSTTDAGVRNRTAIKVIVGLVAAGALIGLFVGLLSATTLRAIGLKPVDAPTVAAPAATSAPAPSASPEPATPETSAPRPPRVTELDAQPTSVSPGQRIALRGQVPGLTADAVLQVQRKSAGGGWEDFPVTARTSRRGAFSTWVMTSRPGSMKFRLVGKDTDVRTPAVTVRIG